MTWPRWSRKVTRITRPANYPHILYISIELFLNSTESAPNQEASDGHQGCNVPHSPIWLLLVTLVEYCHERLSSVDEVVCAT
jgi:hypothetical protein